jgi:hypothetical protein
VGAVDGFLTVDPAGAAVAGAFGAIFFVGGCCAPTESRQSPSPIVNIMVRILSPSRLQNRGRSYTTEAQVEHHKIHRDLDLIRKAESQQEPKLKSIAILLYAYLSLTRWYRRTMRKYENDHS